MADFITGNDRVDSGGGNKLSDKDKKTLTISIVGVFVLLLLGGAIVFFLMNNPGGGTEQAVAQDNEIIKEKKQELTEVYEKSGVEISDDDFVVEEDTSKEVDDPDRYVVEASEPKKEELASVKTENISSILDERSDYSLPPIDSEDVDGEMNPDQETDLDEGSEVIDEEDGKAKGLENQILASVNKKMADIKGYIERSLADTEETYFFNTLFQGLLDTMRTGQPKSPYDIYSSTKYSYDEVFSSLLGYFFYNDIAKDTDPVTGGPVTWDHSFVGSYIGTNVLYSSVINQYYNLTFDTIDTIYEDQSLIFNLSGSEIESYYVAYSGGHYLVLDYDFELLDIL